MLYQRTRETPAGHSNPRRTRLTLSMLIALLLSSSAFANGFVIRGVTNTEGTDVEPDGTAQTPAALGFEVTLDACPSPTGCSVTFQTVNGVAVASQDYVPVTRVLQFTNGPAGPAQTKTVLVPVYADALVELNERMTGSLVNALGAPLETDRATGWIVDDDIAWVLVRYSPVFGGWMEEGGASVVAIIQIMNGVAVDVAIEVSARTTNQSTEGAADFSPYGGLPPVRIPAGQSTAVISLRAIDDGVVEYDEVLDFELVSVASAGRDVRLVANPRISYGIRDVNSALLQSSSVHRLDESQSGSVFVRLSSAVEEPVTIEWSTEPVTATSDVDFVSDSGTVTIPGVASIDQEIAAIELIDDDLVETMDEGFMIRLSFPADETRDLTFAHPNQGIWIQDDDRATVSIESVSVTEGDAGDTNCSFRLVLSNPVDVQVDLDYSTVDGTADPDDYAPVSSSVSLLAGEQEATVNVVVFGDQVVEPDDSFRLVVTDALPTDRALDWSLDGALCTIRDDDSSPLFSDGFESGDLSRWRPLRRTAPGSGIN